MCPPDFPNLPIRFYLQLIQFTIKSLGISETWVFYSRDAHLIFYLWRQKTQLLEKQLVNYVDVSEYPCLEIDFIEDLELARKLF